MSSQENIQNELRSLNSSLPLEKGQPYIVPAGYFEGLASQVLAKVQANPAQAELAELSPLLASIPKRNPFAVPSFYFEANASAVSAADAELETSLAGLSKAMPYQVPDSYFDRLPELLLANVTTTKPKVVPLFARGWMRVAMAAVVAGALIFGGLQLLAPSTDTPVVAQRPADTVQPQLATNTPAVLEKEITQASTTELEAFIASVPVSQLKEAPKERAKDQANVEQLLKDVPTKEVESFLSTLPFIEDDDLMITD